MSEIAAKTCEYSKYDYSNGYISIAHRQATGQTIIEMTADGVRIVDKAEGVLGVLEFAEQCGFFWTVRKHLPTFHEYSSQADEEQTNRYQALVTRVQAAFEYETKHGPGSLINLGHPFVRDMIKRRELDVRMHLFPDLT